MYLVINFSPKDGQKLVQFSDYAEALKSYERQVEEGADVILINGNVLACNENATQDQVWGWSE